MLRLALRGLLARKLRTALTGFAVVLGVAFVAGTFVFTDTIDASFKNLFERAQKGVDVSVQARLAVEEDFATPPTMPADTLQKVESVDGVDAAYGSVSSDGTLLDREGKPILSNGPPTLLLSTSPERFDPLDYKEGGPPKTADQVVIDRATADKYDFKVGQQVTVAGREPRKNYTVSGIATLGDSDNLAGSRMVVMTLPEAQRMTGHHGYDEISVAAAGGTSPDELKAAIANKLGGREFTVRTGKEQADKQAQDLSDALGFIRTALLVFAGVALLVGGFLIFNTFSVTVAQRSREFALLRTLGASRAQLLRSVIVETIIIGAFASVVGILGGVLLAPGLRALMQGFGLDLGSTGLVIEPRTIIAGLVVGMVATVVSGLVPARRATRVEPVEAMREAVTPGVGKVRKRRIVAAALVEALGARAAGVRPARRPGVRERDRLDAGLRRRADDLRLRAAGAGAGAAPEQPDRQAARAAAGHHRAARPRERDPSAAAHRDHRLGADDRPRARRVRGDLRRRPAGDDRPRHRRPGPRGRDRHPRGRLLAAAGRGERAPEQGRRGDVGVQHPLRDRQARRQVGHPAGQRRRSRHRGQLAQARLGPGLRQPSCAGSPTARRSSGRSSPRSASSRSATRCASPPRAGTRWTTAWPGRSTPASAWSAPWS